MKKNHTFVKRSYINAPVEEVFAWHERAGALERLSPPWEPVRLLCSSGGVGNGAINRVRTKAGPFPITWEARHEGYEKNRSFRDIQVKGPMALWSHTHRFEEAENSGCILEDRIEYRLPFGLPGNLLGNHFIRKKLDRMFAYRHRILKEDIARHRAAANREPLNILISGGSGLIGKSLIPFLSTGGHRVTRLVRRPARPGKNEVFWDPALGIIDPLPGPVDAVIHLSGESITRGRWTRKKKKRIIASRTETTSLLANTVANLNPPPEVFLSASAIGIYGDGGNSILSEKNNPGSGFICEVCSAWEAAAAAAVQKGIRTIFLRTGVVLTPAGGALARLMKPARAGLAARIGNGTQYLSWITIDDTIGSIHHLLLNKEVRGPVNLVAPNPATNAEFTTALAWVLRRPNFFVVPASLIRLFFGEMGKEVLLRSQRVRSNKLAASGFRFYYDELEEALLHLLGRGSIQ
ncbi:MAG: TIGR01777 family protein [bacterium]|nr:TIGR01777 family protein [bacterium]